MMPELGKYAAAVLSSYATSLVLIVVLTGVSIRRARKVKKDLHEVEKKVKRDG